MNLPGVGPIVLFRVAAGPRVGFGHLVRALALARAMDVSPVLSIRGGESAHRAARRAGARVVPNRPAAAVLAAVEPRLLVVDDRVSAATRSWRRAARASGIPIASIHDLGIGLGDADLVVDGSLVNPAARQTARQGTGARRLLGPSFAILRPSLTARRGRRAGPGRLATVLIALGGGPRRQLGAQLASAITAAHPSARVMVAGGFVAGPEAEHGRVRAVPPHEFDAALSAADVVVTGGGVTLFEACSLGTPAVGLAIVRSQRPTIEAFARHGAALDGGLVVGRPSAANCARALAAVDRLLADPVARRRQAAIGRRIVDGRGAARVADALARLLSPVAGRPS
jgi:UDP-2,4-diacetamido-2,4,6-trideoxy-beta-L-altropyranose hydrolase